MTSNNETKSNIGIYIYKEAEVLDFAGPFEVFSTANRISSHYQFNPVLIAENEDMVLARGGFKVLPCYTIKNHPPLEVLMIVGGDHHIDILNQTVIQWLQQQSDKVAWITSICTGIFFLAEAAIVKHQSVTTHFEDIPQLQAQYQDLSVLSNNRILFHRESVYNLLRFQLQLDKY